MNIPLQPVASSRLQIQTEAAVEASDRWENEGGALRAPPSRPPMPSPLHKLLLIPQPYMTDAIRRVQEWLTRSDGRLAHDTREWLGIERIP